MCDIERRAYYINDEGIGKSKEYRQEMVKKAIKFAKSLIDKDKTAHNIVFLCGVGDNGDQWLPINLFNTLWNEGIEQNNVQYRAASLKTYCRCYSYNDIIISMGCSSYSLKPLDKYKNIGYIIAVPWAKRVCESWIRQNKAIEIE